MANIVDKTYFDGGELNLPGTDTAAISGKILSFIEKYEPLFLQRALSYPLWKLFKADAYPVPVTQRFIDLLNGGVEYTDGCKKTKLWGGLNDKLQSPIAMYIWYWYQRNTASYNTSQGEQKGKTENATNVSVATKQVRAWNEMSGLVCQLWEYLTYAVDVNGVKIYPEFDCSQTGNFGKINIHNI
jgi:hypothetical protein